MRASKLMSLLLIAALVVLSGGGIAQAQQGDQSFSPLSNQIVARGWVKYANNGEAVSGVTVTATLYQWWPHWAPIQPCTWHEYSPRQTTTNQIGWFSFTLSYNLGLSYYVKLSVTYGSCTTSIDVHSFDDEVTIHLPNTTIRIQAGNVTEYRQEYKNYLSGLRGYVLYGNGHSSIVKPLVVVEGFDPLNTMGFAGLHNLTSREGLLRDVLDLGFDVIIVNFDDGGTYIQSNAFALLALLQEIKRLKGNDLYDIIVIGASMGGLVSRYALAYAETNKIDHYTRLFIAFDSPQQFANVPLGDQFFVKFFADHSDGSKEGLDMLDSFAAQQMLYRHYSDLDEGKDNANSLARTPVNAHRAALLDQLTQYGYPKQTRNVAISNGRGDGQGYGFTSGTLIVDYAFKTTGAWVYGRANAIGTTYRWPVFEGGYHVGLSNDDMYVYVEPGWPALDNCPGGGRRSSGDIADTDTCDHDDITSDYPWHCFVPTISALDIDTTDLFYNIHANIDTIMAQNMTPFDVIYYPIGINEYNQEHLNYNQPHLEITEQNKGWIISEITAPISLCGDVYDTQKGPLTAANPYNVTCDVIVPSGKTLTIQPGVEIYFQSGWKIVANGMLNATGEPGNPIKPFSSDVPDCRMNLTSGMILRNGGELKPGP